MNRQQRRLLQQQGQAAEDGETFSVPAPEREIEAGADVDFGPDSEGGSRAAGGGVGGTTITGPRHRTSPRQFLHEVNVEMRKVAWPTAAETANYATVVFITLALLMALIFALDLLFSKLSVFLFK